MLQQAIRSTDCNLFGSINEQYNKDKRNKKERKMKKKAQIIYEYRQRISEKDMGRRGHDRWRRYIRNASTEGRHHPTAARRRRRWVAMQAAANELGKWAPTQWIEGQHAERHRTDQ